MKKSLPGRRPANFNLILPALCLAAALLAPAHPAQEDAVRQSRAHAQRAEQAYKEKDFAAYLEHMKRAAALRPDHPTMLYNLASAQALAGDRAEAARLLARLAAMGLFYPADEDEDFVSLKETAEFRAALRKFAANREPAGEGATAFTLAEKGLVTEGVAYDPTDGTFYVSSVYRRKILRVGRDGAARDFATAGDGLWSVLGLKVDARRRHLWATTAAHRQMSGFREEEDGLSAVLKFDLRTGKLVKKYALPNQPGRHLLGDLVVTKEGDVFATDSLSPAVYRIARGRDELELFAGGAPFVSPQGLDLSPDGRTLFVADYSKGVFALDLRTRAARPLPHPAEAMLLGIDGLYFHRGALVAVQNGANPQRVVRLRLARTLDRVERLEVLASALPAFDEPTLGVVAGDLFYFVANSQWAAVDRHGQLAPPDKLREHVILKLRL
jgi:SMP-30/Gluconolactonase/LRE-like region